LSFGVITTSELRTNTCPAEPTTSFCSARFIWFWSALAKTSARAPCSSCVRSVGLPPKLNVTSAPGYLALKAVAISLNDAVSDAAANTVIEPETVCVVSLERDSDWVSPPQAIVATATTKATVVMSFAHRPVI
jgi:hypothetical protein